MHRLHHTLLCKNFEKEGSGSMGPVGSLVVVFPDSAQTL